MDANTIFEEDEVCMPLSNGGFKYGLVVMSSEYMSSDEDEDIEDRVQKGTVRVAWHPNGNENVVAENKLILADRSLMPGDVVRRLICERDSQRGYIENIHVKGHLKILGTEQYIYNVDIKDVKPIQKWDPEPDVTLDSWVGQMVEVNEEITVRFPDGARCKIGNANLLNFEDVNDKTESHSEFHMRNFYPGQQLSGSVEDYEDATWIQTTRQRGPKKMNKENLYEVPVVVEKVETKSVDVHWTCKGFTKSGANVDKMVHPSESVEGDNLKRMRSLDCFDYCHRQIGDKGYYTIKQTDALVPNLNPRKYVTPDVLELINQENRQFILGNSVNGLVMLRQDSQGSKNSDCSGKSVDSSNTQDEDNNDTHVNGDINNDINQESGACGNDSDADSDDSNDSSSQSVQRGQRQAAKRCVTTRLKKKGKMKKAKKKEKKQPEMKPGDRVPVEICYTFSQCDVMWQDGSSEKNVPSPELFPIHHLDEMEFFPGDYVVDAKCSTSTEYGVITSCDHKERTVMVRWLKPYQGQSGRPEERDPVELSVYDIKDHPGYKFRSGHTVIRIGGFEEGKELEAVGQVYKLDSSGVIHVWWPDGTVTQNYPQDLCIIGEFDSDGGSSDDWSDMDEEEGSEEDGSSDSDSHVSWETLGEEEDAAETSVDEEKKKPSKSSLVINDSKRTELNEMLQRLQGSVSGLLDVFQNVPGPLLKNSKQIFQDILVIFKKCKELERILKSSFFDDEEITDLITEIREQLRKEKVTKLVKHVTNLYHARNAEDDLVISSNFDEDLVLTPKPKVSVTEVNGPVKECVQQDDAGKSVTGDNADTANGESSQSNDAGDDDDKFITLEGAVGSSHRKVVVPVEHVRDILVDYATNISDPLLQIMFDNSLQLTLAKSASEAAAETRVNAGGDQDKHGKCQNGAEKLSSDDIQEDNTGDNLIVDNASGDTDKNKAVSNEISDNNEIKENSTQIESNKVIDNGSQTNNSPRKKREEFDIPPDHKDMCIRVCRALNPRLLFIQQEITKRWLARKIGCDENLPGTEVFEKLQEKMIESVESGNGPLQLDWDKNELDSLQSPHVENVRTLETLVETRNMENDETAESSVEKTDDKAEDDETEQPEPIPELVMKKSGKGFVLCEEAPSSHRFKNHPQKPANPKAFQMAFSKEMALLQTSLPDGIIVKAFEDRMDLFSVLIKGPAKTPYEDGLFSFDIQLPANYPSYPPVFHYHAFCDDRLNPNLYVDGKVCVSLLGTWSGKGNEVWTSKSNLLQVLVSIQGLILVNEPYFNEAGYEKQRSTQHGQENSRMYNEMAILKLIQSMTRMAINPPVSFVAETEAHLQTTALRMIGRVEHWINLSQKERNSEDRSDQTAPSEDTDQTATATATSQINGSLEEVYSKPEFPLLPASKGFCLTVEKYLDIYKNVLSEHILRKPVHNS